ncbi:MAG: hypothetical protein ACHQU1_11355 [Gemmatimonadales bacterium]
MSDLVWIETFPNEAAADRVRDLLRAHGIEPVVSVEPRQGTEPAAPLLSSIRLGVRADEVRAALTLIWGQRWP